MNRSGTIELPSGRWEWIVKPERSGASVRFQHRHRHRDEMRGWTDAMDPDVTGVQEVAEEPLERIWEDADGYVWRLSLRFPSNWRVNGHGAELWLVFDGGSSLRRVLVSAETRLGELTHRQLLRMLKESS